MPEFIGRPNLPNGLANTLVQLAAQRNAPMAGALTKIGDDVGGSIKDLIHMKAHHEALMQQQRSKENIAKMGLARAMISAGMVEPKKAGADGTPEGTGNFSSSDAEDLLKSVGLSGYTPVAGKKFQAKNANQFVTIGDEQIASFPALAPLKGKDLSTAQWASLVNHRDNMKQYFSGLQDKDFDRAYKLATNDSSFLNAATSGDDKMAKTILERKLRTVKGVQGKLAPAPTSGEAPASGGASASPNPDLDEIVSDNLLNGLEDGQ